MSSSNGGASSGISLKSVGSLQMMLGPALLEII